VLRKLPIHPLLISLYPALALLAANADQVLPREGVRVLMGSLLLGAAVYLVSWLLLRRIDTAALFASSVLLLAFSYGRIYDGLKDLGLSGTTLVRHRFLLPAMAMLVVAIFLFLRRQKATVTTPYLNFAAAVACALPLAALLATGGQRLASSRGLAGEAACELSPSRSQSLPDVYLIIMDAYERDDVLRELHGFDNSSFLERLEGLGFYVARGSLSNYRHTELSLASLLNMDYIQSFPGVQTSGRYNQWAIVQKIKANRVRTELECLGYTTVALETGAFWTEWDDADHYLRRRAGPLGAMGLLGGATRFEGQFLETTLVRAYLDSVKSMTAGETRLLTPAAESRDLILFQLDQLSRLASLPSPKLVFVHILSPHPPFLFGPSGEPVELGSFDTGRSSAPTEAEQLAAYADQVSFLNSRLLEAVEVILRDSPGETVIILQGDHGWADRDMEDKLSILNAYRLPGIGREVFYPTVTPVNSFRLILDSYFGSNLGTLDDISYYSTETEEYEFIEVENTWIGD
jgi:hypothetical protein